MGTKLFQNFRIDWTRQISYENGLWKILKFSLRVLLSLLSLNSFLFDFTLLLRLILFLLVLMFLLMVWFFSLLHFLSHESHFGNRKINNNRSSFIIWLIQFLYRFLTRAIIHEFNKGESFIAFLVVGVERHLYFRNLAIGNKQFSQVLLPNVKYQIPNNKSILFAFGFLLFLLVQLL